MHEVEFLTVGSPFPHHPGQQGNVFRKIPDSPWIRFSAGPSQRGVFLRTGYGTGQR